MNFNALRLRNNGNTNLNEHTTLSIWLLPPLFLLWVLQLEALSIRVRSCDEFHNSEGTTKQTMSVWISTARMYSNRRLDRRHQTEDPVLACLGMASRLMRKYWNQQQRRKPSYRNFSVFVLVLRGCCCQWFGRNGCFGNLLGSGGFRSGLSL